MPLQPEAFLNDRYRILEIIAEGGMGAIYRAFDVSLHIQVALKENFRGLDQFARQFHREAALLAALNHPNLPRVTDYFTSPEGGQYLVMDFIEGADLRQILAEKVLLPESEVTRIGAAVCDALTYLHSRQPAVVHRDIKPGNVKITPSGQVFLVDFGLAKQSHGGEATTTGAQALTPGYAPPEQYGQGTDPRSDVYALGSTLYAALTGKVPEDGLARAMGTATLTPIHTHSPSVSVPTAQAIEKAMSVRPADRFASAAEFRAALLGSPIPVSTTFPAAPPIRPVHQESSTPASSASASSPIPTQPRPSTRKPARPFLWFGLGGVGLGMVGLVAFLLLSNPSRRLALQTDTPSAVKPDATQNLVGDPTSTIAPAIPTATQPPSPTAGISPSPTVPPPTLTPELSPVPQQPTATPRGGSNRIAFASDRSGLPQIWLISPDGGQAEQVTQLPEGACQPNWSPDGQRLVFISPCSARQESYPGASLFIIRRDGKELVPLVTIPGGDFDPAWSPDGTTIAFTSLRTGKPNIFLYDLSSNQARPLSNPVNYDRRPAWSPDGQWIAYETTMTGQSQIWVMDPEGKQKTEFSPALSGISRMPAWAPDGSFILYSQGNDQPAIVSRTYPAKGSPEVPLAKTQRGVEDARVSPDGWQLVFTLFDRSGARDLFLIARNGSEPIALTGAPGADFHPAWQP